MWLLRTTTFTRDGTGRVLTETRSDLATAVTPPSQLTRALSYDDVDLLSGYDPPVTSEGPAPVRYAYDLDKQLVEAVEDP